MESIAALVKAYPQGERLFEIWQAAGSWPVDTPGGRFFAEWETQAPVTREGQLMFFFQFLQAGDRWQELMRECPLSDTGNRGSGKCNVMGTILLSVLCGHWRYAHINSVRGDRVNPALLGMEGTVSEDAVRAALKRMEETRSLAWLQQQILASIEPVLALPWIMDVDSTVKPLYGHQQGAQLGYNPHKPGRPILRIQSVLEYLHWQEFEFLPYAINTPTFWNVSALPPGLAFNPANGRISGAATKPGVWVCGIVAGSPPMPRRTTPPIGRISSGSSGVRCPASRAVCAPDK